MKKISTLLLLCLLSTGLYAQQLDHVLGELLIRCEPNSDLNQLLAQCRYFEGKASQLRYKQAVSQPLDIHLLQFDFTQVNERQLLAFLQTQPGVINVQFNHLIQLRQTLPNDPQLGQQWYWLNNGSNNGVADADVDADLAWDITTGGQTPQGDDIVIAVLDDGTEYTHPDLADNHWVNTAEIPDNNIDDDNNGYVDDYNGWNATLDNDNVEAGDHGVEVTGMLGARGNNSLGITGMNWQVKVMTIKLNTDGNLSEAEILAAYTYPLIMRRRYNDSDGNEGAFVVVTNSSWGLDRGQPEDAPLWCAMYDTLGHAGILNCAATTNQNSNVDIVGDLPTTCTSPYLMGIGSTDNRDELSGGFGPIHVDVAAPGISVYTTGRNGGFRTVQGTSYATPIVAGLAALVYAAPCNNFTELAKNDPAGAPLVLRDYLLSSVDQIDALNNLVGANGRINAHRTLQTLLENCGSCPPPLALRSADIIDTEARLSWFSADVSQRNNLRWRVRGSSNWTTINDVSNPYLLTGIMACTDYEWQVQSSCSSEDSDYSSIASFKTDGCCEPPASLSISNIGETQAMASWPPVLAAQRYQVRIRQVGGGWSQFVATSNSAMLTSLLSCTEYEVQVRTVCENETTSYTDIVGFRTTGCGNCIDLNYCNSESNSTQSEWIDRVELEAIDNTSGNNNGYLLVASTNATLNAGSSYTIRLTPGYAGSNFSEVFRVWIDFNQDGDFNDADELVFTSAEVDAAVEGNLIIPASAEDGGTRMRVSMKFNVAPEACETIDFGEVEDYCVTIVGSAGCFAPTATVTPEAGGSSATVELTSLPPNAVSYQLRYRKVGGSNWTTLNAFDAAQQVVMIDAGLDFCSDYELQLQANCDGSLSNWSTSFNFTTLGCGACFDQSYCESRGNSSSFEFLQRVRLNTLDNNSGNNGGYGDFTNTDQTTALESGSTYQLTLTPEFPFNPFEVAYRVWIDYNQDGDFMDSGELVYDPALTSGEVSTNLTIPANAPSGSTRMRIAMREEFVPEDCGVFPFGETEDYCISIIQMNECSPPQFTIDEITPNSARLSWPDQPSVNTYQGQYRVTGFFSWQSFGTSDNFWMLTGLDSCQEYEVRLRAQCGSTNSDYTQTQLFNTDCSTATTDPTIVKSLRIFPNPFRDQLNIALDLPQAGPLQLELMAIDGRVLLRQNYARQAAGAQQIELAVQPEWPSGVLLLRLQTQDGTVVRKVLKAR
ncbi:MAG: GEVED domain-containing protein [Bacteroidota bacterium]